MRKRIILFCTTFLTLLCFLTSCDFGEETAHTHTYSEEWKSDENSHWHEATCEHTAEISDYENHVFINNTCSRCGYTKLSTSEEPVKKEEYTIVYNANEGLFEDESSTLTIKVTEGNKLTVPEEPTKEGYTFKGWYKDEQLTSEWNFITDTISKDTTLYAAWESNYEEHNVTFNLNYDGLSSEIKSTFKGLVTYIPTRDNYVFNGWWYSDGRTNEGVQILLRKFDTKQVVKDDDLVLYADWIEESTLVSQLKAPSIELTDDYDFSWDPIPGARGYHLTITKNGSTDEDDIIELTTTSTQYHFFSSRESGYYTIRIRALGDGITSINSAYATKSYAHKILAQASSVEFNASSSVLTWTTIKNASRYELYVDNKLVKKLEATTYDLSDCTPGSHSIKIIATNGANDYVSSTTTTTINKIRLNNVGDLAVLVDKDDISYNIYWNTVAVADTYIVTIGDKEIRMEDNHYSISYDSSDWNNVEELKISVQAFDSNTEHIISTPAEFSLKKIYTLTINQTYSSNFIGEVTASGSIYAGQEYTVSFDMNGSDSNSIASQTVNSQVGLTYPAVPTRSGYLFTGWYEDKECTKLYDFTQTVQRNTILYAGWYETEGEYSESLDITSKANSYSYPYKGSIYYSSTLTYKYIYFTILKSGSFTFNYRSTSSAQNYAPYIYVYNKTANTVIKSNGYVNSTTYSSIEFEAEQGDIIYVRTSRYNKGYTAEYQFYITGAEKPDAGGKVSDELMYRENGTLAASKIYTTSGSEIELKATQYENTPFIGWFDGENMLSNELTYKVTMGSINKEITAKWELNTLTLKQTEGGVVGTYNTKSYTVSYNLNGSTNTPPSAQNVSYSNPLIYPTIPTRSGYVFTGWYDNKECQGEVYDFTKMIEKDITLYASWYQIKTTGYSEGVMDIYRYNSSSLVYGNLDAASTSSYAIYTYFSILTSGTHRLYYGNLSSLSYSYMIYVYNVTAGTVIKSNTSVAKSTAFQNVSFEANAGDVIYIRTYRVSTTSNATVRSNFYVTGGKLPDAGAHSGYYMYENEQVDAGESVTINAFALEGYKFDGWYNGDQLVSTDASYTFVMPEGSIVYTPKFSLIEDETTE